jgi:hypothetical protein
MKSKEISPHEFYFINESLFSNLVSALRERGSFNISTIGFIDFDFVWYLNFENSRLHLNISRASNLNTAIKKEKYPMFYMLYGELKLDGGQPVLVVQFHRTLGNKIDLEALKSITVKKRELINEALNQEYLI